MGLTDPDRYYISVMVQSAAEHFRILVQARHGIRSGPLDCEPNGSAGFDQQLLDAAPQFIQSGAGFRGYRKSLETVGIPTGLVIECGSSFGVEKVHFIPDLDKAVVVIGIQPELLNDTSHVASLRFRL
ncbi:MAG: hypothetical protein V7634_407, partial [Bradyrhizobium sp.]